MQKQHIPWIGFTVYTKSDQRSVLKRILQPIILQTSTDKKRLRKRKNTKYISFAQNLSYVNIAGHSNTNQKGYC